MRPDDTAIDNCLKCAVCNDACPVFGVHSRYPGPKHLGPELERLRREGISTDTEWLEYCLGCHRCDLACPHQVSVSEMIAQAKAEHRKPLVRALRDWWFARPGLLGMLTTILPEVSNFALSLRPARFLMSKLMLIAPHRKFPSYTRPNLQTPARGTGKGDLMRVVFFPGCFIRYNRPDLGRKAIDLLELNGFAVDVASTGCCGVPATANGDQAEARAQARANVCSLVKQVEAGMRVVTACSSCGYMLKTGFGGLLSDEKEFADAARRIGDNTLDAGELLMAQSDAGKLNTGFKQVNLRLAYHAPCHQKAQGMGRPWYHLLSQIPGLTIEDMEAGCCGMSGTYGFKQEKYNVSMAVGQRLFDGVNAAKPEMVATECATCQMQIEHGTTFRAIHPVEVLFQAYDGQPL